MNEAVRRRTSLPGLAVPCRSAAAELCSAPPVAFLLNYWLQALHRLAARQLTACRHFARLPLSLKLVTDRRLVSFLPFLAEKKLYNDDDDDDDNDDEDITLLT